MNDNKKIYFRMLYFDYLKGKAINVDPFKSHPEFMDSLPYRLMDFYNDEYDNEKNFGLEINDDKCSLAHAYANLTWIEKNKDKNDANIKKACKTHLKSLEKDYENYFKCVAYCKNGDKKILRELTETMLAYGMQNAVLLTLELYIADTISDEASADIDNRYFPDFYSLYIKAADAELYNNCDFDIIMRYYDIIILLPILLMKEDQSTDYSNIDDINDKSKADNSGLSDIFGYVLNGSFVPTDKLNENVSSKYKKIVACYNDMVHYNISYDNIDNICKKSDYVFLVFDNFLKNNSDAESIRIIALISNKLYSKYLLVLLYKLSMESEPVKADFTFQGLKKLKYINDEQLINLKVIYNNAIINDDRYECFKLLSYLSLYLLSRFIMECLRADNTDEICYYTSLANFSFMLPYMCGNDSQNGIGKLTIMNLSYMNDPNEGLIFKKILFGDKYRQIKNGRRVANVQYVFVKCFSQLKDYLPMWNMYGDNAEGLCLIINWKDTINNASFSDSPLYNVCYVRYKNGKFDINDDENPNIVPNNQHILNKCIGEIIKIIEKDKLNSELINDITGDAAYLFKDGSYSYEMEQRILYSYKEPNKKFLHTNANSPLVYVQPNFTLQIKEIIIGPKFREPYMRLPFLKEQIDIMCKNTNRCIPDITLSDIEYR